MTTNQYEMVDTTNYNTTGMTAPFCVNLCPSLYADKYGRCYP